MVLWGKEGAAQGLKAASTAVLIDTGRLVNMPTDFFPQGFSGAGRTHGIEDAIAPYHRNDLNATEGTNLSML